MDTIFELVYSMLLWASNQTGLSYEAINIIVYYFIIPFIYALFLDRIFNTSYFKIALAVSIIGIILVVNSFESFARNLFDSSVDFLLWFESIGLSYIQASVIICVIFPVIIFLVLFFFLRKKAVQK